MWAWHRVQRLLNEARKSGDVSFVHPEIVRLCEGYSIVSEYASFLVLENDGEYQRWKIARRNAARMKRDRQALSQLRRNLAQIQSRAASKLGPNPAPVNNGTSLSQADGVASPSSNSSVSTQNAALPPQESNTQSRNLDFSPGVGGGAIDPITGALALGLAGAAAAAARRRRGQRK
jgi:hypothetical protein